MFAIIDLGEVADQNRDIVNKSFDLWWAVYEEILKESNEKLVPEYFWRSKLLTVNYDADRVRSLSLHNFFDVRSAGVLDLSYFSPVNDLLKQRLKNQNEKMFSVEWVTVDPDLRGKRIDSVKEVDLIMGLAFRTLIDSQCTAAMGFSRLDLKADKCAEQFGFERLDLIKRHDIDCGVMYLNKKNLKSHPNPETQARIDDIYSNAINYSSYIKHTSRKVAA